MDVAATSRGAIQRSFSYRFIIHDHDSIFSRELDQGVTAMEVQVLRTPVRAPKANSVCERLGGTLHRECLNFLISVHERHLKRIVSDWISHYNHGRHLQPPASASDVRQREKVSETPTATLKSLFIKQAVT
jgi:hypothetical protein